MPGVSVNLRHAPLALLIGHNECGAYGGTPAAAIVADLARAAAVVRSALPSLNVECYFADFDGIYRCDSS